VDAVYCDAYIDDKPIYLIVDTGLARSLASKAFLDKIGRTIDTPSPIKMVDINGGKKRSLGKVKQLPINIKGTIIPIDVDVSESTYYSVIVGNDWLTKTKGVIDFNHGVMELNYNNKRIRCGITCWEKQKYDEHGTPMGLEEKFKGKEKEVISEDEYEEEEPANDQSYCALMGNAQEKPLLEVNNNTVIIGDREEPITYLHELENMNHPIISTKAMTRDWKGPNFIC